MTAGFDVAAVNMGLVEAGGVVYWAGSFVLDGLGRIVVSRFNNWLASMIPGGGSVHSLTLLCPNQRVLWMMMC
jgi:hypothetical protein